MSLVSSPVSGSNPFEKLRALNLTPTVALSLLVIAIVVAWSIAPQLFTSQSPINGVPADKLASTL